MACGFLREGFLIPETCPVLSCSPTDFARGKAILSVQSSVTSLGLNTICFAKRERAGRMEFVVTALSSYTFCFKISKHLTQLSGCSTAFFSFSTWQPGASSSKTSLKPSLSLLRPPLVLSGL